MGIAILFRGGRCRKPQSSCSAQAARFDARYCSKVQAEYQWAKWRAQVIPTASPRLVTILHALRAAPTLHMLRLCAG